MGLISPFILWRMLHSKQSKGQSLFPPACHPGLTRIIGGYLQVGSPYLEYSHKKCCSFKGWRDPLDLGALYDYPIFNVTVDSYRTQNILRHIEIENVTCKDPEWMGSDSFYPKGTIMFNTISFQTLYRY